MTDDDQSGEENDPTVVQEEGEGEGEGVERGDKQPIQPITEV